MYYETLNRHDCCGCFACEKICGVKAVTMKEDEKSFLFPVVDETKCVHCGLCAKVCPMEKNYVGQDADPGIYAAANKDTDVVKSSSSGGIFSKLCEWVLAQDGVIYGAAFDENFMVRHMRAETAEEAVKFRGSKYVESTLEDVYAQAEADLRSGKTVLLSGTPCQISALKSIFP